MTEPLHTKIIEHLKSSRYRPTPPRRLARDLNVTNNDQYHVFRDALRELMRAGRVILGDGNVILPTQTPASDRFTGVYRHNKRGFGFVVPTDPASHEDLYIPEGENGGALTGDVVAAVIASRGQRDGKAIYSGRIIDILQRTHKRFVGTLARQGHQWLVLPDGNTLTEQIAVPDASSRHAKVGAKVVVELTTFPEPGAKVQSLQGVILEVLGAAGAKDVDLRSVIVQHNLPGPFPEEVMDEARRVVDSYRPADEARRRTDLAGTVICTIDPDDAKDYDDAISLTRLDSGRWELGVHIADVSYFVEPGSALDVEARARGNSCYFPGHVIPMLPEILSNGVCSLQEGVPRLCKSAFIEYDDQARPVRTRFANTVIHSAARLRYTEAQAIIDRAASIPHPDGPRTVKDYPKPVVDLLDRMNDLAHRIQKRRNAAGQIVLELPEIHLVLDDQGRVTDAVPEDTSFTHTLIEMFMVEANEAAARLLESQNVDFLRRKHPEPDVSAIERLRHFAAAAGYRLDKQVNHKSLQLLLAAAHGKPSSFAINLAVLKSLARAEYSPDPIGHYALASKHYTHFTSPIRRYADLTIHRLLDAYLSGDKSAFDTAPTRADLVDLGRHISFTERRGDDAERELRKIKVLTLLQDHVGDHFEGVVTGLTNFGLFVQLRRWLIDGLIRYEELLDDWWQVDEKSGSIRGQRTGRRIKIGDLVNVVIVNIDLPRRELNLAVVPDAPRPKTQTKHPDKRPIKPPKPKPRRGKRF